MQRARVSQPHTRTHKQLDDKKIKLKRTFLNGKGHQYLSRQQNEKEITRRPIAIRFKSGPVNAEPLALKCSNKPIQNTNEIWRERENYFVIIAKSRLLTDFQCDNVREKNQQNPAGRIRSGGVLTHHSQWEYDSKKRDWLSPKSTRPNAEITVARLPTRN